MIRNIEILAIQSRIISQVAFDHFLLFRMDRDQHIRFTEDTFETVFLVNQHISGRRAEKELQPRHTAAIQFADLIHIIVRPSEEERIVGGRRFRPPLQFPLQVGDRGRLRLGVRHIHESRYTAGYSCTAFAGDVSFMSQTRFTEMHLVVNGARQ